MAAALLFVVHGERRASLALAVPVEARLPPGVELEAPLPATLKLAVSGPWARLRDLDPAELGPVVIDLSRTRPGAASWAVRPDSVRVPAGVHVDSLYPSQGVVELAADRP
jgi:hypothetical protein